MTETITRYLLYLDSHPEEYLKYLGWWKIYCNIKLQFESFAAWKGRYKAECVESWGCELCREVSKVEGPKRRQIPSFLNMWTNSTCYSDWTYQERSEQWWSRCAKPYGCYTRSPYQEQNRWSQSYSRLLLVHSTPHLVFSFLPPWWARGVGGRLGEVTRIGWG